MKKFIKSLLFVLILSYSIAQNSGNNPFYVSYEGDNHTIYKIDGQSGKKAPLYQIKGEKIFGVDMSISPNNNYIAFIVRGQHRFIIINSEGKTLKDFKKPVKRFDWNGNGEKLAFITGKSLEEAEATAGFKPLKTFIYHINTDNLQDITIKNESKPEWGNPFNLHWMKNDSKNVIYFERFADNVEDRIIKYDVKNEKVMQTNVKGINFSPDGKYYYIDAIRLHYNYYDDYEFYKNKKEEDFNNWLVLETKTNQPIPKFSYTSTGVLHGWVGNNGHSLAFIQKEYKQVKKTRMINGKEKTYTSRGELKSATTYIYNVETQNIIDSFNGMLPNKKIKTSSTYLPLNKVSEKDLDSKTILKQVLPEDVKRK